MPRCKCWSIVEVSAKLREKTNELHINQAKRKFRNHPVTDRPAIDP